MAKRSSSPSAWWKTSRSRRSGGALLLSALLLICAVWAQGEKGTDASSGRKPTAKEARKLQAKQMNERVGDTLRGRAVKVQDGDTFDFLYGDNEKQRVRVAQMDAPEKSMPFGQKSKELFTELVMGKEIALVVNTVDRYGRVVGSVVIDGEDGVRLMTTPSSSGSRTSLTIDSFTVAALKSTTPLESAAGRSRNSVMS